MSIRNICFLFILLFSFASNAVGSGTHDVKNPVAVKMPTCAPGAHWVRAHPRAAYFRADGTFVSASFVTAHCQGNPRSYNFWHLRLMNQRPMNWPTLNNKEKLKVWTEYETERVYEALDELPEIIWVDSIKSISRMDKSIYAKNHASSTPGHIVLYDSAFEKKQNLARIISHELAHEYFVTKMTSDERKEYGSQALWFSLPDSQGTPGKWTPTRQKYVAEDSNVSLEEDFANNLEFYLFNNAKLRDVSPEILEWIQFKFGDRLKVRKR